MEPGVFEAFYAGEVQHPVLLWLSAAIGLGVAVLRTQLSASMRTYCAALFVLSCMDAWLTANHVFGVGSLAGPFASLVPLFFVLAGDCRYLLLVLCATDEGEIRLAWPRAAMAAGLTVIVPVLAQAAVWVLPEPWNGVRVMFFIYEVSFAVLALTLLRRGTGATWVRSVSRFVVAYYSLWATADLFILVTGSDLGYLLRVLPNLLYYGGLIGVMGRAATKS
jgi:hypothetical protein